MHVNTQVQVKVIYLKCRSSDTFSIPGNFTQTLEISLIDSEEEATSITPANGELSICFSLNSFYIGAQGTPDAEQRTKSSNRKLKSGFSSLFSAQGPIGIENMFSISFSKAFLR